jgi:hypothetical protein
VSYQDFEGVETWVRLGGSCSSHPCGGQERKEEVSERVSECFDVLRTVERTEATFEVPV